MIPDLVGFLTASLYLSDHTGVGWLCRSPGTRAFRTFPGAHAQALLFRRYAARPSVGKAHPHTLRFTENRTIRMSHRARTQAPA